MIHEKELENIDDGVPVTVHAETRAITELPVTVADGLPWSDHLILAAPDLLEIAKRTAAYFDGTDAPLGIAAVAALRKAGVK